MSKPKAVNTIIKEMLEHVGIEDVYDFPPSALDCACPIVVTPGTYEQTDVLEDCEYGTVKMEVIAVRETRDVALSAISKVIYALHQADWERWGDDTFAIRNIQAVGLPKAIGKDESGRNVMKEHIMTEVVVARSD